MKMSMIGKYVMPCLLMVCSYTLLLAGNPSKTELDNAAAQFPNADAIFLHKNRATTIQIEKGQLSVTSAIDEEIYFVTDQSEAYRTYQVYHSYFDKIEDLKASTLVNNNGKFKELKVEDFTTEDNVSANVFYDDLKQINFIFPGVGKGSLGKISYTENLTDPHLISSFYFPSYLPVLNSEYVITCPSSVKLKYKIFNNEQNEVSVTTEEKGHNTIYRFTAKNIKHHKREENAPAFAYYAPHVLVTIAQYPATDGVKKVIPDLSGLCDWYKTFLKDLNKDDDSTLKALVKSITKTATGDEQKIRDIYYWVQNNINYVAFEDGMNGFVPREARDICTRRYGDCKDMASLMVNMLHMAGVKAYHTWIGTRSLPYKYSDMPSPEIDNHMICVAEAAGKRYVLDATGKFTPLGFVTGFIQGKESLILKDDGNCEVYNIPAMPKEKTVSDDTITVDFTGSHEISGQITTRLTGYYGINEKYMYHYTLPEKREEKFENSIKIGNNKCRVSAITYAGFGSQDSAVTITAKYQLQEYVKNIGQKIYLNPNLSKDGNYDDLDLTDRTLPFENEFKNVRHSTTIISIPDGYQLDYKPKDVNFKNTYGSFAVNYKLAGNKIIQDKELDADFLIIPVADLVKWNEMITEMSKAYMENIVFIKK